MSLKLLTHPFPWALYSKKLIAKIENPRNVGKFDEETAKLRQMRVVSSHLGSIADGNFLSLYLLVDPEDGMIVDAKFQTIGNSALIGALDAASELVIQKYYDQAKRISAELIDKHLRDKSEVPAFPKETHAHLNLVIDAIEDAASQCLDIPLPAAYVSPVPKDVETIDGGYPGWETLTTPQKLTVIEEVVKVEIRPYIELDGGGIDVINLLNDREVIIAYKGSCTSCFSSTGATLSYIQQTLKAKISQDLIVVPDFMETNPLHIIPE